MGVRESNVVVLNIIIIPNLIGTDTIRSCWNGCFVGRTTKPVCGGRLRSFLCSAGQVSHPIVCKM